jgi:site-specific DNA recombinase
VRGWLRLGDPAQNPDISPRIRTRMDQIYEDKLEGNRREFLDAKAGGIQATRSGCYRLSFRASAAPMSRGNVLTVERFFELASKAHFLYLTRSSAERGQRLKTVLLNCATDGVTLTPTYRKPFDLIFQRAKNEEWSGRADLNCRPLAPQASALPG